MSIESVKQGRQGSTTLEAAAKYDPFVRGRFPVGVRTLSALDKARNRTFPCEIWYPADAQYAGQDLAPGTQDVFTIPARDAPRSQMAVRDAAAHPGPYPLVIFSHHSGGHRRAATFLCTHLGSHGYVVAALDHSEALAPELARPRSETEEQKKARWQAVIASRVPDVRFLLDQVFNDAVWKAEARLNPAEIGIVGHSFGAWTALATPEDEPRIRAVVALAPGGSSNPRPGILPVKLSFAWPRQVPALYLVAENDVPLPLAGMRELFERAPAPKQMVILRRADHLHFIDNLEQEHETFRTMPPMAPELAQMQAEMRPITELCSAAQAHLWVRGLTLAHMDATLRRLEEAREFLSGDIKAQLAARGVEVIVKIST
jgi:predicted dienelactone hydrolase